VLIVVSGLNVTDRDGLVARGDAGFTWGNNGASSAAEDIITEQTAEAPEGIEERGSLEKSELPRLESSPRELRQSPLLIIWRRSAFW
jgi:hypothetical protein